VDHQGRPQAGDPADRRTARVKFLRQLGAATLVVAVVVGLGLAWNHFASATLVGNLAGPGGRPLLSGGALRNGKVVILPPGKGHGTRLISLPPGAHPPPGLARRGIVVIVHSGPMDLGLGSMFDPVNLPSLTRTVEIEIVVLVAVVLLGSTRRQLRGARRKREAENDG
jgi:hypothetical protein